MKKPRVKYYLPNSMILLSNLGEARRRRAARGSLGVEAERLDRARRRRGRRGGVGRQQQRG
uniref:Umc1463 n=1 Tax=Arundo donax TaxID=35708 RepID=A0A0A9HH20_ARUDO